ncbi:MAG: hypothetical protein DRO88_10605 [Promethearchaeia archaeon]|nr:MAG: hypothetical protein DRO88_10605 [Candidatus Lokiarchaeia archaeon]
MKKITRGLLIMAIFSVFIISALTAQYVAAQGGPNEINVGGNKHQGTLVGNSTNRFTFQNRFQMQMRVNQTLNLSINCDDPGLADREFEMELNISESIQAEMTIQTENSDIGLTNGSIVQNRNRMQYRYQEQFMINVSLNESVSLQARLALKMKESNSTWAYYDEAEEEWVPVESNYENGMLVAMTDHFSSWTILTREESSDNISIPGYLWIGVPSVIAIGFISFVLRRKRN